MKTTVLVFIAMCMAGTSCIRRPGDDKNKEKGKDTLRYFQVNQYLQSQIKEVNATPFFIYKIDIVNSKKDSTPINTAIFNQISKQFLEPDINEDKIKKYYIENIFEDRTTNSFTIEKRE